MPITIRDLASKTNLSITTVSRALDGYSDVSQTTRERVIQAAREIGYQPSAAARHLRRQKSDAIGYILPTPSPQFSDYFFSSFLEGLCDATGLTQFDMLISSAAPESEAEKVIYQRWVESKKVDGLVLNRLRIKDWRVKFLQDHQIPFVTLGTTQSDRPFPYMTVNNAKCFSDLTNHLILNGHKRIAFLGSNPELVLQDSRFSGYRQAMEENFGALTPDYVFPDMINQDNGYKKTLELVSLSTPPTAYICSDDLIALGVYRAIQQKGMIVGKDIAVTGFGGFPDGQNADPPLSTVIQPGYQIAQKLAEMLFAVIEKTSLPDWEIVFDLEICIRESSDFKFQEGNRH